MNMEKKSNSRRAYGILNAYGELWTPFTWGTIAEADNYLSHAKEKYEADGNNIALNMHKVVAVKIVYKKLTT